MSSNRRRFLVLNGGSALGKLSATQAGTASTTTTGTVDDLAFSNARVLRCNNATLLTIRGLAAGIDGQRLTIISVGAGQVDFAHENANSAAANRLVNFATVGLTSLAPGKGRLEYQYDAGTARWQLITHEQGDWITPTFAAGDYTGSASMTWTLAGGDVLFFAYWLRGKQLTVLFDLETTSVGGTPAASLQRLVPGGHTTNVASRNPISVSDNGTLSIGYVTCPTTSNTLMQFRKDAAAAVWTAATNTTAVIGEVVIGVN